MKYKKINFWDIKENFKKDLTEKEQITLAIEFLINIMEKNNVNEPLFIEELENMKKNIMRGS